MVSLRPLCLAATGLTGETIKRMAMEKWTLSDEYIILVETNEKKAMSTCRFHAHGGVSSQQA